MRCITVFTKEAVSTDMLLKFLREIGGVEEADTKGVYFRRFTDEKETATIWVDLDTKVEFVNADGTIVENYYDEEDIEDFRRTMGGFPKSEIYIRIIGANTREASTEIAYQVAEKLIGTWGGCVYSPGFKPATEWLKKLPHLPWD